MSVEFVLRLVGMVLFSIVGVFVGAAFASLADAPRDSYAVIFGLIGALTGLILTPYLTTRPARYIRGKLARVSAQTLVAGLIGLVAGLLIAALLAFPLSLLPEPFRSVMPFFGVLVFPSL